MNTQDHTTKAPNGAGSFCIPRAAFNALLDARATAYEVCTYLVLARFTDSSGRFSTASISAVNRHTGANKVKGGTVDRAHQRLLTIRAKTTKQVSNGLAGKKHEWVNEVIDLGPILYTRDAWHQATGEIFPDGPHERAKVLHILSDFEEPQEDRIWFGNNLVTGVKTFGQPLKSLKNAGDVAARLLLSMYAANDMETWGGIRPVGKERGPWHHYEPVAGDNSLLSLSLSLSSVLSLSVSLSFALSILLSPSLSDPFNLYPPFISASVIGIMFERLLRKPRPPPPVVEKVRHIRKYSHPLFEFLHASSHGEINHFDNIDDSHVVISNFNRSMPLHRLTLPMRQ